MREQHQVTINNNRYLITAFGGIQGLKLGKRVAKVLLPVFSKTFGEEDEISMVEVMEAASEHLDDLDEDTVQELLSCTTKNNMAIDFDTEFSKNYMTLFKLLWEIIQFNFSDLFFGPVEEGNEEQQ